MTLRNFWMYPPEVCWYPRILEHTRCFMMIPSENYFSENSDPQRLFYPSETVMVSAKTKFPSVFKSDILQNAPLYPLNMLPCCSFSFKQFYHVHPKNLGICLDVPGYSDCHKNFLLIYVDILRKLGWYPHTIRWYFSSNPVNHMVDWYSWQKSAKILFHTEKGNSGPCDQKYNKHAYFTKNGPRNMYYVFSMVPCIHGKCW